MRRGRQGIRTPQPIVERAIELAYSGKVRGNSLIHQLELDFPGQVDQIPSARTIRGWVAEARQVGQEPWTLADAGSGEPVVREEDLSAVLGVMHDVGTPVTRQEAPWVARLRRIAPGRPAWAVLAYARMYARRLARGATTADLDREVARWVGGTKETRIPVNRDTLPIIGRRVGRTRKERTDV